MPSSPDAPGPAPEKTIRLTARVHLVALAVVLFFTALNGLFNSLNIEYGGKRGTFLDRPADRHADLIKAALSLPPYGPDYLPARDHAYRDFYVNNSYKRLADVYRGKTTILSVTPFMLLLFLILKPIIILFGPAKIVQAYYVAAFSAVALLVPRFRCDFWESPLIFFLLVSTYPFLMILCRANSGALLVSLCLICIFYQLFLGQHVILAAFLLAIAFNCRPNVIILIPLLAIFGWRDGLRALLVFALAALALFAASYTLDTRLDPHYNLSVFGKALQIYYKSYVLNSAGSYFNNSAFGAIWPIIHNLRFLPLLEDRFLDALQLSISLAVMMLISVFLLLYLRRQIDKYEYAFALGALYVLGSTIFSTYHLFFFAFFILVVGLNSFHFNPKRSHYFILAASVFMLVPKNYVFNHGISYEVVLNPLMLAAVLAVILFRRAPVPAGARFRDTLNWQRD